MPSTRLWARGAGELAASIASREVSSREVVEAHLERIESHNPALNALVRVLADEARAGADDADRAVAAGEPLGPLHGVPVTVKENVDLAGTPTTQGIHALAEAVPPGDAPLVERLRGAGAIPIGRGNMPDLGLRLHTDSSLHGLTRNPWSPGVTAGGSSGGEAAAIAAGMAPLGVGNDIGGSLRNPAHCCGIAAIKPTTGRVPHATAIPPLDGGLAQQLMMVNGTLARRVADVRLGLGVIAGPHWRDPTTVPAPLEAPAAGRRRVALAAEPPLGESRAVEPEVAAIVRAAGDALAAAGYEVVEAVPDAYEQCFAVWADWLLTDLREQMPLLRQVMGPDGIRFLEANDARFEPLDADALVRTFVERHRIARLWAEFFERHALLVTPVWSRTAFPHGYDVADDAQAGATLDLLRCVVPHNALGLPAAVVPGGLAGGLPVGVQISGPRFSELACLDAAEHVERALGLETPIDPAS